jgi:hypothetical protein
MYLGSIYAIREWEGLPKVAATKTGPNNASRVVWAIGKFVFFLPCFLITN